MVSLCSGCYFELTMRTRCDLKQAITDVGNMAKNAIDKGFEVMLNRSSGKTSTRLRMPFTGASILDALGLRKIGIPHTNINVCEGDQGARERAGCRSSRCYWSTVIELIRGLVKKASDLWYYWCPQAFGHQRLRVRSACAC